MENFVKLFDVSFMISSFPRILAALPMAFAIIPNKALRERLGG